MVCEAARTMRMPQGTRVAAHTSPWRSNESSPKLNMTVDEQLPTVRTVAGDAGGQGFTLFFRSGGLTLRNSAARQRGTHFALGAGATLRNNRLPLRQRNRKRQAFSLSPS